MAVVEEQIFAGEVHPGLPQLSIVLKDDAVFDQYVDEIRKSKTVIIPKSLTKLQVLTKCRNVDKIVKTK